MASPSIPATPPGVFSRRTALRSALGGTALAGIVLLGGCRLRLQDDAPALPLVPRESIEDQALLLDGYHQAGALAALAAGVAGTPLAQTLAAQHERQASVLRQILSDGGVPASVIDPAAGSSTTAATSGATSSPTGTAEARPVTAAALAASTAQAVQPEALQRLAGAVAHRPLLTAIAAHRGSAATLLGTAPGWTPRQSLPSDAALAALDPTREAVYATEVAAARVPQAQRAPFLAVLETLRQRAAELRAAANGQGGDDALAYRLPFPVVTVEDARRLVGSALDALVNTGLQPLTLLPAGAAAVAEVTRLQAQATVLRHGWGLALPAFPGLADG